MFDKDYLAYVGGRWEKAWWSYGMAPGLSSPPAGCKSATASSPLWPAWMCSWTTPPSPWLSSWKGRRPHSSRCMPFCPSGATASASSSRSAPCGLMMAHLTFWLCHVWSHLVEHSHELHVSTQVSDSPESTQVHGIHIEPKQGVCLLVQFLNLRRQKIFITRHLFPSSARL